MNTDVKKSPLISAILLEISQDGPVQFIDLEATEEQRDILSMLLKNVSYSNKYYTLYFCEGPGRQPVSSAALGRQSDLEEMPLVRLLLHIDATLLTVEQIYNQYREQRRTTP